jgi:hypothetical protein
MANEGLNMRPIGTVWCDIYHCEAEFFIERIGDAPRELVVRYGAGYDGPWLPTVDGKPQFGAVIPSHWTEEEVTALLLTPQVRRDKESRRIIKPHAFQADWPEEYMREFPTWEAGARWFGSEYLAWPKAAPRSTGETVQ